MQKDFFSIEDAWNIRYYFLGHNQVLCNCIYSIHQVKGKHIKGLRDLSNLKLFDCSMYMGS